MNLQQLRYLCGIADHELNISKAAEALHTSQPGVTRQIRQLEEELKAELLVRRGNRISALTEAGFVETEQLQISCVGQLAPGDWALSR
jgi:LysR family cys regulon transcriptional activator